MATFRIHKTRDYTVMSNRHFREKGMSLKAKGLLSLMLSLPEDWDYSAEGLATLSKDGRDGVKSGLRELERFGYLVRTKRIDESGRFSGYDYDIFEDPGDAPFVKDEARRPSAPEPSAEKPSTENPPQSINQEPNIHEPSTEEIPEKSEIADKQARAPFSAQSLELEKRKKERRMEALEAEGEIMAPTSLARMLINAGYVEWGDPIVAEYNDFLIGCMNRYGWHATRISVAYFLDKVEKLGNLGEIGNRLLYFKSAMEQGLLISSPEYKEEVARRLGAYEEAGSKR